MFILFEFFSIIFEVMYLLCLKLCNYYFEFMYLNYVFILFELCLFFLNSCIYLFEFMHLLLF